MKNVSFPALTNSQIRKIEEAHQIRHTYRFYKLAKACGFHEVVNGEDTLPYHSEEWKNAAYVFCLWTDGKFTVNRTNEPIGDMGFCQNKGKHTEDNPGIAFWVEVTPETEWILEGDDLENSDWSVPEEAMRYLQHQSVPTSTSDGKAFRAELARRINKGMDLLENLQRLVGGVWVNVNEAHPPSLHEVTGHPEEFRYVIDLEEELKKLPMPGVEFNENDEPIDYFGLVVEYIDIEEDDDTLVAFNSLDEALEWREFAERLMRMRHQ